MTFSPLPVGITLISSVLWVGFYLLTLPLRDSFTLAGFILAVSLKWSGLYISLALTSAALTDKFHFDHRSNPPLFGEIGKIS